MCGHAVALVRSRDSSENAIVCYVFRSSPVCACTLSGSDVFRWAGPGNRARARTRTRTIRLCTHVLLLLLLMFYVFRIVKRRTFGISDYTVHGHKK